jgi:hypothetical protein
LFVSTVPTIQNSLRESAYFVNYQIKACVIFDGKLDKIEAEVGVTEVDEWEYWGGIAVFT